MEFNAKYTNELILKYNTLRTFFFFLNTIWRICPDFKTLFNALNYNAINLKVSVMSHVMLSSLHADLLEPFINWQIAYAQICIRIPNNSVIGNINNEISFIQKILIK